MKSILSLLFLVYIGNTSLYSQNIVTLQHNGTPSFHTNLNNAFSASQSGDTIYIPGGNFAIGPNLNIDKQLYILGVGHNPDSTSATLRTFLTGDFNFIGGATGSVVSGVYLTGNVSVNSAYNLDAITVTRCNIGSVYGLSIFNCTYGSNPNLDNWVFSENIIRGTISGFDGVNNVFTNNIIGGNIVSCIGNNSYLNNIFLYMNSTANPVIGYVKNATIKNNVFRASMYFIGGISVCGGSTSFPLNNTFYNNIIVQNYDFSTQPTFTYYNNYINIPASSIFVNQTGNVFSYQHNYHLQSPSTYVGDDGTQCGIYGGFFPWKEGSVPINPHVQYKNIANTTDANGNLIINIQVGAQDH